MLKNIYNGCLSFLGLLFMLLVGIALLVIAVDYVEVRKKRRYYGNLYEVEYYERPVAVQEEDFQRKILDSVLTVLRNWNRSEYNNPKIPEKLLPFLAIQVVHETDFLRSRICRENNNWFGMKCAQQRARTPVEQMFGHASYAHVSESIRDMVFYLVERKVLYEKFNSIEQYCKRLSALKYAEDPYYCDKIVSLNKRLFP